MAQRLPRRDVRHPRRRPRPAVPAPRERAGAVAGRRLRVRAVLAAQRWVTQGGAKMSKSLGNGLLVTEVLAKARRVRAAATRSPPCSTARCSSGPTTRCARPKPPGTASRASSSGPSSGWARSTTGRSPRRSCPTTFVAAMDDDLNVPAALAVVHEHLRAGNSALADGATPPRPATRMVVLRAMLDVLGLDPAGAQWARPSGDDRYVAALESVVAAELDARAQARAATDFATVRRDPGPPRGGRRRRRGLLHGARWTLAARPWHLGRAPSTRR